MTATHTWIPEHERGGGTVAGHWQAKPVTPRDELLWSIFVTALEGGIGYWSVCTKYHWSTDGGTTEDYRGFIAEVTDVEDEAEHGYFIDRTAIDNGYTVAAATPDVYRWSTGAPPLVVTADTDWDFDAGDADAIVQLGLFDGKIIYG